MMKTLKLIPFAMTAIFSVAVFAQNDNPHSQPEQSHTQSTSQQAYMKTMDAMHEPMMQSIMDTEPDVAFIKGMIPHHQGAIDMAKVVLEYGYDPEVRKLAEQVIQTQQEEIQWMNNWLKQHALNKQ